MGQKVHPGGLRVGVIHDWKSNWYTTNKDFKDALLEDIKIREHINKKLGHAGLSDILIRKDKQRITIDIYTARPGIVIGKSGRRGRRAPQGRSRHDAQERPHQHQRDQASRAGREARRAVDRGAAREPVSFRRAMKRSLASAMRSGAHGVRSSAAAGSAAAR
jgi:small subunit ribosomal protein S3